MRSAESAQADYRTPALAPDHENQPGTGKGRPKMKHKPRPRRVPRREAVGAAANPAVDQCAGSGRAADEGAGNAPVAEDGKYDPTTFKAGQTRTVPVARWWARRRSRQRLPPSARPPATCSPSIPTLTTPTSRTFPNGDDRGSHPASRTKGATLRCSGEGQHRRRWIRQLQEPLSDPRPVALPLEKRPMPLGKRKMPESENRKTESENRKTESENRKTESAAQKHKPVSSEQFATFRQQKSSLKIVGDPAAIRPGSTGSLSIARKDGVSVTSKAKRDGHARPCRPASTSSKSMAFQYVPRRCFRRAFRRRQRGLSNHD